MDMVMGNEHTSHPVMLLDINASDGPLDIRLSSSPTPTLISTPPSIPPSASGLQPAPMQLSTSETEEDLFSIGRKVKKGRNRGQAEEYREETLELFRREFETMKVSREKQDAQTDALVNCMQTLVNHFVKE
jgi:hypothetical protein